MGSVRTWVQAVLWVAVVVLPGGLLLLPVIYAVHRRGRAEPEGSRATPEPRSSVA